MISIAFIGMTHLGLISAIAAAEKGFKVICFDPDLHHIAALQQEKLSVNEPSLVELLKKNKTLIRFTSSLSELKSCDIVYFAPDIPTNDRGQSNLRPLIDLIELIKPSLNQQALVIILSQVPPGFTRKILWNPPQLFYQVETLIFGQAVERALHPERFMIGSANPKQELPTPLLAYLKTYGCPIFNMKYESAELSKIAINLFLVASVSTTNTIAELCEKIGANWEEIKPTLQLDKRIGQYAYLSPGLGLAGGNLERDLTTFCTLSDLNGTDSSVIRAYISNSRYRKNWVLKKIHEDILPFLDKPVFAVLGLAYKKDTASIKNSPSLDLLSVLSTFSVRAYDPVVKSLPDLFSNIQIAPSAKQAIQGANILVLMTPWGEFYDTHIQELAKDVQYILDPYAIFKKRFANHYKLGG